MLTICFAGTLVSAAQCPKVPVPRYPSQGARPKVPVPKCARPKVPVLESADRNPQRYPGPDP